MSINILQIQQKRAESLHSGTLDKLALQGNVWANLRAEMESW